ncbi:MAG: HD domain-containing protein [Lachnospiraceae bacterium]|nr:HD domain-containing protein [Lachnospiraceae bacterium]
MRKIKEFIKPFKKYIYDSSIDIRDRAFMVFSVTILAAIFLAVPCGLIMHEPLSATVSTLIGGVVFSAYVWYSFFKRRIDRARVVISVFLVFVFLPAMFFTNGGAGGGAPVWLLLGTIYIVLILEGRRKWVMLFLNVIVLTICWCVGYYHPELVTEYTRSGNYFDAITALFIVSGILTNIISFQNRLFRKEEEDRNLHILFEQTATALANAIDAKDKYTHGHSSRVADYSRRIAEMSGMDPETCNEVYYAAMLHDVGKIGIPEEIINKEGRLTDEEYAVIKQHPVLGERILHSINVYPSLSIGAYYHHERYDGRGYPAKLKGEDIPELARIISVADAYDAMTSKRSYRDPIPQQIVREEIVKGSGTQFDPKYAKIMQHLIDLDTEYLMKEKSGVTELAGRNELSCKSTGETISDGILINAQMRTIRLKAEALERYEGECQPNIILFDSLDGRYHDSPKEMKELNYFEYARIRYDGDNTCTGARKIDVRKTPKDTYGKKPKRDRATVYEIKAVRVKDHLQLMIDSDYETVRIILALPDSVRFSYMGLTGDNCHLFDVSIIKSDEKVPEGYIPRIAEEISFINVPAGDIPNIQVDGYRFSQTDGIPVKDGMKITFHTMSLPTARLVWHCAFLDLFYSDDRRPEGETYKEYALIRLDGENWESEGTAENKLIVNLSEDFVGWDEWRTKNKEGYDCTVTFKRTDNKIVTHTENLGIEIINTTTILDGSDEVYVALTGDQCAITNIRIIYE